MPRKYWLLAPILLIALGITWLAIPREYLPDFLRRAGKFRGPHDDSPRPTAYWIERLRSSPDVQERRDAAYALAIISYDYGLDREAKDVVPVLIDGLKDPDDKIRQMSANALGSMGRHAAPAITALIAEAANRESEVREVAIVALGQLGPVAKEAVPVLLEAYREKWGDAYSHHFTGEALKRIDPQAAAAAGVR
jgi:HEAT repeat protein